MTKGRRPKPAALHKLHGSFRADRHAEPIALPAGCPDMPDHLDEVGQAEWARVVHEMHQMGTIHTADRATIAAHAVAYSHMVQAERELQVTGLVIRTQSNEVRPSPWLKIYNDASAMVRQFAIELGLSPSSRTKLTITGPPEMPDGMDLILANITERDGKYFGGDGNELTREEVLQRTAVGKGRFFPVPKRIRA